jgi:phage-related minor tail protein
MTQKKLDIVTNADPSGAKAGLKEVEDAAKRTGDAVAQAGEKGAKGFDGIGKGAEKGAREADRATKSIIASIERATAAAKAGERGTASYFEAIANQRGANADALRPYLEQLRQAEAAQRKAEGSLQSMGVSAAQTAAALRQVPAQFTDIAVSLQAGQAPLTVLLQQGGQLKDSFGGAGAAAQALGKYVLGLINPFTLAAAGAGALAYGFLAGREEAERFNKTLILSGNAAGTTASTLIAASERMDAFGTTQAKAAESLNAFIEAGVRGSAALERYTLAAIRLEEVGGDAVEKTAKAFAELGQDPLKASLKLNEATNFLTKSVYDQIVALEEQGRTTEAAKVAQDAFADAIEGRSPKVLEQIGSIERGWLGVKNAVKEAGDALLSIGREDSPQKVIEDARARLRELDGPTPFKRIGVGDFYASIADPEGLTQRLKAQEEERIKLANRRLLVESEISAQQVRQKESIEASERLRKQGLQLLAGEKKLEQDIEQVKRDALAADWTEEQTLKRIADLKKKANEKDQKKSDADYLRALEKESSLLEKLAGLSGSYYEDLKQLQQAREAGRITEEAYAAAVTDLTNKQPFAIAQAKEEAEAIKQVGDAMARGVKIHEDWIAQLTKGADQVAGQVRALEDEAKAAQLSADKNITLARAIQEVAIARLEEQKGKNTNDPEALAQLDREIAERRKLIEQIGSKEAREASKKAAEQTAKDYERIAGQIEQSLADALMQGGKSAKEYLEGLFRQMVLRPLLQPLVQPIAGLIAGAQSSGGQGGMAGGAGVMGQLQQAYGVYQNYGAAIGTALFGNTAAYGGVLASGASTAAGSQAAMLAAQTQGFGLAGLQATQGAAATATGYTGASAGASSANAAWGAYWPLAIVAGMLASNDAFKQGFNENSLGAAGQLNPLLKARTNLWEGLFGQKTANIITGASLTSAIFGRAAPRVESTDLVGTFGPSGFSGDFQANILEKGGLFRSDKRYSQLTAVTGDLDKALDEGGKQIADLAKKYGAALGLPVDELANVSQSIKVKLGANDEENKKAIEEALKQYTDALLGTFAGDLEPVRKSGEELSQTIERLGGSLLGVNETLKMLGLTALETSVQGGSAAVKLAEQFGGLNNLAALSGDYYQRYYTEAERASTATDQIASELAKLGIAMPATKDGFRALVEAQDLTTDSGQKAFATLLGLAGVFDEVSSASERTAEQIKREREQLDQAIAGTLPKFLSDMERQAFEYQRIASELAKQGVSKSVEELMSATKDEILDFARTFVSLDTNSNEAKLAIVNLAGALADLKGAALDFVQVGSKRFDTSEFNRTVSGITQQDILNSIQSGFTGADLDRALGNFQTGSGAFLGAYANTLAAQMLAPPDFANPDNSQVYSGAGFNTEREVADAQKDNTDALKRLTQTLEDELQGLIVGDLSPLSAEEQLKQARASFDQLYTAAQGGDLEAGGQVGSAAREFLQLAQAFSPSQYAGQFDEVRALLSELLSAAQAGNLISRDGLTAVQRAAKETAEATYQAADQRSLQAQRTVGLEL